MGRLVREEVGAQEVPSQGGRYLYYVDTKKTGWAEFTASLVTQLAELLTDLREDGFWLPGLSSVGSNGAPASPTIDVTGAMSGGGAACLSAIIARVAYSVSIIGEESCLTIVRERFHVDAVYRDCYYTCYSRQHLDTPRFSQRLSFFLGGLSEELLLGDGDGLQERFIGSVVLNPVASGSIGRTLIQPKYLLSRRLDDEEIPRAAVRTSRFKTTIMGIPLEVDAFPYRSQDGLFLRCVEITLVNMIEYYSNEYGDYGFVLPSRIHEAEAEFLNERTIPAKGISYLTASKLLSTFGFQASLHGAMKDSDERIRFKRIFHHYIESGIPVAMNLSDSAGSVGHSLVCIGTGGVLADASITGCDPAYTFRDTSPGSRYAQAVRAAKQSDDGASAVDDARKVLQEWDESPVCSVVMTADLCNEYVVVDDNQAPYRVRGFDSLSRFDTMENSVVLVALHKGIMLDARDAEDVVVQNLSNGITGLFNWGGEYLRNKFGDSDFTVAMRLFLASSRRYKATRSRSYYNSGDLLRSTLVSSVVLPHFLWVCELYLVEDGTAQLRNHAFAEIVVDATYGKNRGSDTAVVFWNFPERVAYRDPDGEVYVISSYEDDSIGSHTITNRAVCDAFCGVAPYDQNLKGI